MRRMDYRIIALILVLPLFTWVWGFSECADCTTTSNFTGTVGVEFTFVPVPPTSYDITTDVSASFTIAGFSIGMQTAFDLAGFQSLGVDSSLDLGAFGIGEEILFDPYFSWNDFSLTGQVVGVELGLDLILANIGTVQTPSYSMGAVLSVSSGLIDGFSITALTGFGATDLVNALDGVEAPFSHDLLYLYNHLADLAANSPTVWRVTIVPGFYFEEELVRLEVDTCGLIASSTTWLDTSGFSQEIAELGYRLTEPSMAFLTAVTIDSSFSLSGLDFILDVQIDPVRFTSKTSFAAPNPPLSIPVVFDTQGFALSFDFSGVLITSETDFDYSFMFSRELIGIETTIDPVTFTSLTEFDLTGFTGEWIEASVKFSGITLSTAVDFDFTGITRASFGFSLTF